MILGILNQGKMTSFVNILELQKPILDLSLKKASKWPRFDNSQNPIMKLIPWTKISPKIHPSLINRKKMYVHDLFKKRGFCFLGPKIKIFNNKKNFSHLLSIGLCITKSPLKYLSKILTLLEMRAIFLYYVKKVQNFVG